MTFRDTFTTPYEQHAAREGEVFTVIETITEPDEKHDAEVLPMYRIQFADGATIEAWPEEVIGDGPAERERLAEREALRREARQEALLDAGPILAEHRREQGE